MPLFFTHNRKQRFVDNSEEVERSEADYGLRWDPDRQVWVGEDGFAYDGERLYAYSRAGLYGRIEL